MSGPKGVSLQVRREVARARREMARQRARQRAREKAREKARQRAEARERAREQARIEAARRRELQQRANALSKRANRLAQQWQEASRESGGVFTEWSHQEILSDLAECESGQGLSNEELTAALDRLAEQVAHVQREFALQASISKLRSSFQMAVEAQAAGQRAAQKAEERRTESAMRRFAEDVSKALETLAGDVPPKVRAAIEAQSEEAIRASATFRRNALLTQLRLEIRHANDAAAERRRVVAQIEEWRDQLLGIEGQAVDELNQKFKQVIEGEAPPADLGKQVDRVVARAAEASDREYAQTVIMEELENLGYVVESGFETASAQHPEVLLRKPGMEDGYLVSLRAGEGILHNRVVRETADPDQAGAGARSADRVERDSQAEQTWCEDLAAALAASELKGVQGRVVSRKKVGEVPVKAIAALAGTIKAKTKRKRKQTSRMRSQVSP